MRGAFLIAYLGAFSGQSPARGSARLGAGRMALFGDELSPTRLPCDRCSDGLAQENPGFTPDSSDQQ